MKNIFTKINNENIKKITSIFLVVSIFISPFSTIFIYRKAEAVFNKEINYQGKLTTSASVAVPNGSYNIEFKLYTISTGGSAIWTESRTGGNRVAVANGLFSVMLGEVQSLAGIDFNQTLYLGVNIGGTAVSPVWDGEMTPRKKLGAVPAAIEAEKAAKTNNLIGGNATTLLGSVPYQSGADTTSLVAPNTTTSRKFFRMTGDGTNGAAPIWDTLTAVDVGLGNVTNESKATMFTSPIFTGTVAGFTMGGNLALGANTLTTTNTTLVSNLNADLLDGQHASAFQTALTNPITGTGTTNYLPKFTGTSALGNSLIFDNGTNVGIGTTTPTSRLNIVETGPASDWDSLKVNFQANGTANGYYTSAGRFINTLATSSQSYAIGVLGEAIKTGSYGYTGTGAEGRGIYRSDSLGTQLSSLNLFGVSGKVSVEGIGANTINSGKSIYAYANVDAGNTLTTYTGVYVAAPIGTGTITNKYALITEAGAGNVGIGTTNPGAKLHISDDTINALKIGNTQVSTIGETDDGGYPGMKIAPYNSNLHLGISGGADNALWVWDAGTSNMKIQELGTHGLITENSTQPLALQMNGGKVGIGMTAPGTKLQVAGDIYASGVGSALYFETTGGGNTNYIKTINDYTLSLKSGRGNSAQLDLETNAIKFSFGSASGLMGFRASGNLGVGTTTATSNFQVTQRTVSEGTVSNLAGGTTVTGVGTQFTNTFKVGDTITIGGQTVAISAIASDTSMTTAAITNANTAVAYTLVGGDRFVVKGNGNVGVGTTVPSQKLHVVGDAYVTNTLRLVDGYGINWSSGSASITTTGSASYSMLFNTYDGSTNSEKMRILGSGNIGIGTTGPNQQLEITKNFRLPTTTYNAGSPYGIIYKDGNPFIHNFNYGLNGGGITTSGDNTFVGVNAGNFTMGSTATAVHHGSYNTAIGVNALKLNTTGYYNTAIGSSLQSNTTGSNNVAIGKDTLLRNTTGSDNFGMGTNSLYENIGGIDNIAIGSYASYSNTTGNYNSAIGYQAGRFITDGTTGNTTGDYNLFLGMNTKALADNDQNEIVIGYNATGIGSNTAVLGNDSITKTILKGNVGIGTTAPGALLDISTIAGSNPSFIMTDGDITHGLTTLLPTNALYGVKVNASSSGGSWEIGVSEAGTVQGMIMQGVIGATDPTDSVAAVLVTGSKSNGTTGAAALGSLETVFQIENGAATSGTKLMTILGSGNVGIGTTAPGNQLDVRTTGDYIFAGQGAGGKGFVLANNAGYADVVGLNATHGAYNDINFRTSATAGQLYLKTDGTVGIGTTAPGTKLEIEDSNDIELLLDRTGWAGGETSSLKFRHGTNENYVAQIQSWVEGSASSVAMRFYTSTGGAKSERMVIRGSGNVGIGTTAPTARLHVVGSSAVATDIIKLSSGSAQMLVNNITSNPTGPMIDYDINSSATLNDFIRLGTGTMATSTAAAYQNIITSTPTVTMASGTTAVNVLNIQPTINQTGTATGITRGLYINPTLTSAPNWRAIEVANGNVLFSTTSGSVGIGTTAPDVNYHIDIQKPSAAMRIQSTTATNNAYMSIVNGAGGVFIGRERSTGGSIITDDTGYAAVINATNTYPMQFGINYSTKMTILNSGNVGIGTTNPSGKLDIVTATGATTPVSSLSSAGLVVRDSTAFATGVGGVIMFTGKYNTAGDYLGGSPYIRAFKEDAVDGNYGFGLKFGTRLNGGAQTEALTILGNGNVGIGTTAPGALLQVGASGFQLDNTGKILRSSGGGSFTFAAQSGDFLFNTNDTGDAEVVIKSTGNVGIGTTAPAGKLHVETTTAEHLTTYLRNPAGYNNMISFGTTVPTNTWSIGKDNSEHFQIMEGSYGGTSRFTILDGGNVGIGTTAPANTLDVNGSARLGDGTNYALFDSTGNLSFSGSANYLVGVNDYAFKYSGGGDYGLYFDATNERYSFNDYYGAPNVFFGVGNGNNFIKGNLGLGTTTPTSNLQVSQSTGGVGTVSNTAGGTTVTGVGTQFTNTFKVGDAITIGGQTVAISAIASDTSMTTAAITNANTAVAYTLVGGDRFVVKGNGNVGIGTTTPEEILHVSTNQDIFRSAIFENINTGTSSQMLLQVRNEADLNSALRFGTLGINFPTIGSYRQDSGVIAAETNLSGGLSLIARNASGIITLTTGGYNTERMRIDSAGNVGIGTTSPDGLLEIESAAGADATLYLSSGTSNDGQIIYRQQGTNRFLIGYDNLTTPGFRFYDYSGTPGTRMFIQEGGNVGIGTTTPTNILSLGNTSAQKIWIENTASGTVGRALTLAAGSTVAGGTDIVGGNLILQSGLGTGTGDSSISFQTGTTLTTGTTLQTMSTKMTILGNGNVGINNTSPGYKLDVSGYIKTTIGYLAPAGSVSAPAYIFSTDANSGMYSVSNDVVGFSTGGTNVLTLNAGNVGIGTTTPASKMEIGSSDLGNGVAGPVFTLGRNTNATNTGAGSINFMKKDGTAGYVWQDAAGNMRINTSAPTNALDTSGTVIGAQTSTRDTKQDIDDYSSYDEALEMIVNAPLHTFRYKNEVSGYGTDSPLAKTRIGFIADEVDAMFMVGNSIDQVSVNGLLMASIKAMDLKVKDITSLDTSIATSLGSLMKNFLGDINNGVVYLYASVIQSDKIETEMLCVGSVCVTEEQFMEIVTKNVTTGSSTSQVDQTGTTDGGADTTDSTPTDTTIPTDTTPTDTTNTEPDTTVPADTIVTDTPVDTTTTTTTTPDTTVDISTPIEVIEVTTDAPIETTPAI